jgi:hypothetical protein
VRSIPSESYAMSHFVSRESELVGLWNEARGVILAKSKCLHEQLILFQFYLTFAHAPTAHGHVRTALASTFMDVYHTSKAPAIRRPLHTYAGDPCADVSPHRYTASNRRRRIALRQAGLCGRQLQSRTTTLNFDHHELITIWNTHSFECP